ncbi:hypothetical protein [Spirosoma linguale]
MKTSRQTPPAPGDYYGTVYKGGLIVPILTVAMLVLILWWFLRKRK